MSSTRRHISSPLRPITPSELRERLSYDETTGWFVWVGVGTHTNPNMIGRRAGYVNDEGYRVIAINNCRYFAHNLAWFWIHGEWPAHEIDHRDGGRDTNAISNLRPATDAQQSQNQRLNKANKTGYKGVSTFKDTGKYRAKIFGGNDGIHLGTFEAAEDAARAYDEAAVEAFGPYAILNFPHEWGYRA